MKQVLRAKQRHPASFRYYKVMKGVVQSGAQFVEEERENVQRAIDRLGEMESKEYAKLRAMQNVLTQFERVDIIPQTVVEMTHDCQVGHAHPGHLRLRRERKEKRYGQVLCALVRTLQSISADLCGRCKGAASCRKTLQRSRLRTW